MHERDWADGRLSAGREQEGQFLAVTRSKRHSIPELERHDGVVGVHTVDVFGLQKLRRSLFPDRPWLGRRHDIDAQVIFRRDVVAVRQHQGARAGPAGLATRAAGSRVDRELIEVKHQRSLRDRLVRRAHIHARIPPLARGTRGRRPDRDRAVRLRRCLRRLRGLPFLRRCPLTGHAHPHVGIPVLSRLARPRCCDHQGSIWDHETRDNLRCGRVHDCRIAARGLRAVCG